MTASTTQPFNVWINPEVLEKFNMYAAEALIQHNSEIGGFIKLEEDGENVFVTDVFIPKQQASGASFEVSAEMDNEFLRAMMKEKRLAEIPQWKGLVHSHPEGMGPSMSGVDVTAIQRRAEDSECFSLILSAKRSADSTRMAMHYCMKFKGKTLMFRDLEVKVGWDQERLEYANKMSEKIAKDLGATSPASCATISDAIQSVICELPPTFEEERKVLRDAIRAEVKEKITNRFGGGRSFSRGSHDRKAQGDSKGSLYTPWLPSAAKYGEGLQAPLWGAEKRSKKGDIPYTQQADLQKSWKNAQRLYAIGYDKVDPSNPNPNSIVTKGEAKKARGIHRKLMIELNKELAALGGPGMGDLVIVNILGIQNNPGAYDMHMDPSEVEDFTIQNGAISFEVGGEIFWPEELEIVTPYIDLMDWTKEAATA